MSLLQLSDEPQPAPAPQQAAAVLAAGQVVVMKPDAAGALSVAVEGDRHVVVTAGGGERELTTLGAVPPGMSVNTEGTYLNVADLAALGNRANPQIRLYGGRDTWRKVRSRGGALVVAALALALISAGIAAYWALAGQQGTSAATVASRAETIMSAVANADAAQRPALTSAGQACLRRLGGNADASKATFEAVECAPKDPSWWRDEQYQWVSTLLLSLATSALTVAGLGKSFGFGKQPT